MRVSKKLPAIQECIDKLEAAGLQVHMKYYMPDASNSTACTRVVISNHTYAIKNPRKEFEGLAICSPKDNFNREEGTKVAFNRALREVSATIGRDAIKELLS